jgi:hypothetical protein
MNEQNINKLKRGRYNQRKGADCFEIGYVPFEVVVHIHAIVVGKCIPAVVFKWEIPYNLGNIMCI